MQHRNISKLDAVILVGAGGLFAGMVGFGAPAPSILQIVGGAAWGIFFAYVLLVSVRRGSGGSFWDLPSLFHLGVNVALSSIAAAGTVFGGGFPTSGYDNLTVVMLVVAAIAFAGFFRLIVKISKKL